MRRRRHLLQVSTFPFLAVLLCAMGSLILLLLVIDRRARAVAQAKVEHPAERLAAADSEAEARRAAELERRRQALHDEIATQDRGVRDELGKIQVETNATQRKLDAESAQADVLKVKVGEVTTDMAATEASLRARHEQVAKTAQKSEESQRELGEVTTELTRLERTLADLQKARERDERKYSLVPYKGRRGDDHKPIYVECAAERVIFHPDRTVLDGYHVSRAAIHDEVKKRIDQQRDATAASKNKGAKPYVLLLVRPDGIMAYYQTMAAVDDLGVDFGYELVEADWIFDFSDKGPAQPWTIADVPPLLAKPAPAPPRRSKLPGTGMMKLGSGASDQPDAPGVDRPISSDPRIAGRDAVFGPSVPNSILSSATSGAAGLGATLGNPGVVASGGGPDGLHAIGTNVAPPGSATSSAAILGPASGASAVGPPSSSVRFNSWTDTANSGTSGNGFSSSTRAEGTKLERGNTSGTTAMDGSSRNPIATTGTPTQLTTTAIPQRAPNPGTRFTSSVEGEPATSATAPRPGEGPSQLGSEPRSSTLTGGREARADAGHAASGLASSTGEPDTDGHSGLPHRAGNGDASGSRGGIHIGPDLPLPESEKKAPPPPRPVVFGNRDWIITVECLADGVRVYPGGKHFTTAEISASKNSFSLAVQSMIERRQAMVRPGEPPFRPIVRFFVHPDGLRTYYVAYPTLEPLHVLMTRENWHAKPKAGE